MGNLHLVTGSKGKKHVTAADHASLHAAIFGEGQYVLDRGNKFAASIVTNNQIRVADGDILMQGRHIRLNEGSYVDVTIENGAQNMFRNDLIVARYTKDSATGVEDCNLVVIKGTAAEAEASDPEYTSGDIINDHVLIADMPLYRVPLNGLNVQELVPLFEEASLEFPDGSINGVKLADKSVTTAKVANKAITREKLANDALYSPIKGIATSETPTHNITIEDLGYTLRETNTSTPGCEFVFNDENSIQFPDGAEIAFLNFAKNSRTKLVFQNTRICLCGETAIRGSNTTTTTLQIAELYGMCAVKKLYRSSDSDVWLVTGNVEVVS